jgi:hypothetical protein
MMNTNSKTSGRLIRLEDMEHPVVHSICGGTSAAPFEPFPIPAFPLSQLFWLEGLMQLFFRRHERAMASLLLLDVSARRWNLPILPHQQNSTEGVSFWVSPK